VEGKDLLIKSKFIFEVTKLEITCSLKISGCLGYHYKSDSQYLNITIKDVMIF
jgi:hypothetical protein